MSNHELQPFGMYCKSVLIESGKSAYQIVEGLLILALAVISPAIYLGGMIYFGALEGRSNCLVWAVWCKVRNRKRRIVCVRNVRGRRHWQVIGVDGSRWEWYAKGASQRSRLANLWYRGESRKVSE